MNTKKTAASIIVIAMVVMTVFTGAAAAKSVYLIADHHTGQFDAWNIYPNGTASYQASYNLVYASDPSGIAVDESSKTLFVTTEFSSLDVTFEFVDATTMTSLGYVSVGPGDYFAGIAVDDANDIVYTVYRGTDDLYAFDWDPTGPSVTLKAGYPIDLPNCAGGAMGIALDETTGTFWVADYYSGVARAYDTATWTEDTSKSYQPSAGPMDIAVDRQRGFVYTTSCWTGSNILSKYDLATSTETTVTLTCESVGVDVDELTGYVYVTISPYCGHSGQLQVWDTSTTPWTQVDVDDVTGSPAGICIPQGEVVFNPLNLTKEHGLTDCVKPGDSITYTICYDNMRNPEVHNVTIVDDLPAEVSFVSATDGGTYDSATHTVTWDIGTIPAQTSQQCVQLVVKVDNAATPGINITNSVTISGAEPGYTGPTTVNAEVCVLGEEEPPCCVPVPVGPGPSGVTGVPLLTPFGAVLLIGLLAIVGAVGIRRRT